jgi:membrane protease YdiL (CAAX protease family)
VGSFAVLPLWLCYEALRLALAPHDRNGAEVLISEVVRLAGPTALSILRVGLAVGVAASAVVLVRRRVPWLRVTAVTALGGLVYALILGPLAGSLEASSARVLQAPVAQHAAQQAAQHAAYQAAQHAAPHAAPQAVAEAAAPAASPAGEALVRDLVGSLGAGIFEELVFRLILLSLLALLLMRAAVAFGLPRALGVAAAVLLSALVFSLFHHIGPGASPLLRREFVFRAIAGLVLGVMFVLRGFGVCVYTHTLYDIHYYLTA